MRGGAAIVAQRLMRMSMERPSTHRISLPALLAWLLVAPIALAGVTEVRAAGDGLYRFDAGLALGSAEQLSPWWATIQRNARQDSEFDLCLAARDACSRRQRPLRRLILRSAQLDTKSKIELVNRYLNRTDYELDRRNNNPAGPTAPSESKPVDLDAAPRVSDGRQTARTRRALRRAGIGKVPRSHWSTLYEFLDSGGDCEDYASSKYFLLRKLGVPAADMRVVVTYETKIRGYHAVLAYRWPNNEVWLLESDNRIKKRSHRDYRYVYAVNEQGIWDYRDDPHAVRPRRF